MGTDKRERQKAARAARIEAERQAEARKRKVQNIRNLVLLVVGVIVLLLVMSALTSCGSSDSSPAKASSGSKTSSVPKQAKGPYGSGMCPATDGSSKRKIQFDDAPKRCIDPAKRYTATLETSLGTAVVDLDTKRTPVTTNNFVALARYGYYDATDFFRTEAGSGIIQGGSPHTQDNSDPGPGPNFSVPDEGLPFSAADYGPGTLAMARTAAPNSASGQFFFLATDGGRYLGDQAQIGPDAGSYAAFGSVTEGLDVLQGIAALDDGSSTPTKQVGITTVTITES